MHNRLKVHILEVFRERFPDRRANQFPRDVVGAAHLSLVFKLELSGHRRDRGIHIGDARDHGGIAAAHGALFRAAQHVFKRADRKALAHTRPLVHALIFARLKRHFLDDLADVLRNLDSPLAFAIRP